LASEPYDILATGFASSAVRYLPDKQLAPLAAKARAQGVSPEQFVRMVLDKDLAPEWLQKSRASAAEAGLDRLSMSEIDAEIAAARAARRKA